MKKKTTLLTALFASASIFFMVSCSKTEPDLSNNVLLPANQSMLLSSLENKNEMLIASKPETKGLRSFFKRVFQIAKADIVGAVEAVLSQDETKLAASIIEAVNGNWTPIGVTAAVGAAQSSYNAYKEKNGHSVSFDWVIFYNCVDYIGTRSDTESIANKNSAVILEFDEDTAIPDVDGDIAIPLEYRWTLGLGKNHNIALNYFRNNENGAYIGLDDEDYLETVETTYGIDSSYKLNLTTALNNIHYNIDFSTYFSNDDLIGQVLILYGKLYDKYVSKLDDVITITNQYISSVYDSDELTDIQKATLISALCVSANSSAYWADALADTE